MMFQMIDLIAKLRQVKDLITSTAPNGMRQVADILNKTEETLREGANFLEGLGKDGSFSVLGADGREVTEEEKEQAFTELNSLRSEFEEIATAKASVLKFSAAEDPTTNRLPPGLQKILAQLLLGVIDRFLNRKAVTGKGEAPDAE